MCITHLCLIEKKFLTLQIKNNKMELFIQILGFTLFAIAFPLSIKYTIMYGKAVFKK